MTELEEIQRRIELKAQYIKLLNEDVDHTIERRNEAFRGFLRLIKEEWSLMNDQTQNQSN